MDLQDKIIVITGAGKGIGQAMAAGFANAGAHCVVCSDINGEDAKASAKQAATPAYPEGVSFTLDVRNENEIAHLINEVEKTIGPIDLFCSNAGILTLGGVEADNQAWQNIWDINLMAHVYAARHMVERMRERGHGYLLNVASAAGLLSQIGSAPYAVTKHAAVGLAEWLAITHGDDGIKVSVLCPQAVRTEMTRGFEDHVASIDGMLEPEEIVQCCIEGIREENFLILPHPKVRDYMQLKSDDYERWIGGMRKLNRQFTTPQNEE